MRKQYIASVLLAGIAACHSGEAARPVYQSAAATRDACVSYCTKLAQCFQDVCDTDFPRSVDDWQRSQLANNCVHQECDPLAASIDAGVATSTTPTSLYAIDLVEKPEHQACMMTKGCREILTGACGDASSHCTDDPKSVPVSSATPAPL